MPAGSTEAALLQAAVERTIDAGYLAVLTTEKGPTAPIALTDTETLWRPGDGLADGVAHSARGQVDVGHREATISPLRQPESTRRVSPATSRRLPLALAHILSMWSSVLSSAPPRAP